MPVLVNMQKHMQKRAPKPAPSKKGDGKMGDNEDVLVVGENNTKASVGERPRAPSPSVPGAMGGDEGGVVEVVVPPPRDFGRAMLSNPGL